MKDINVIQFFLDHMKNNHFPEEIASIKYYKLNYLHKFNNLDYALMHKLKSLNSSDANLLYQQYCIFDKFINSDIFLYLDSNYVYTFVKYSIERDIQYIKDFPFIENGQLLIFTFKNIIHTMKNTLKDPYSYPSMNTAVINKTLKLYIDDVKNTSLCSNADNSIKEQILQLECIIKNNPHW